MGRRETNVPPAGTVLRHTRIDDGQSVECVVTKHGFMFSGKVYPSLTGAARIAAKSIGLYPGVNGCLFWGLRELEQIANDPRKDSQPAPPPPDKPVTSGGFWWHGDGDPEPDPQNDTG